MTQMGRLPGTRVIRGYKSLFEWGILYRKYRRSRRGKRGILLFSLIATNTAIWAQGGGVGPAVVVDPPATIAASRGTADGQPQPTPRLADGTVNLGRDHGEKGI